MEILNRRIRASISDNQSRQINTQSPSSKNGNPKGQEQFVIV